MSRHLMPHDPDEAGRLAVAFVHVLRGAGLRIPIGATLTFAAALGAVGLEQRDGPYWAGRATLLDAPEDTPVYDRCFEAFWGGDATPGPPAPLLTSMVLAVDTDEEPPAEDPETAPDASEPALTVRWSPVEVLRDQDFAAYSPEELDEARRLMADLRLVGALRTSRRHRPTRRDRGRPDVRRTVRRSLRAGGELMERAYTRSTLRPRRIVLLCDVSGSMEPYARAFLRFQHAAVTRHAHVEAFALGTRLTRLTRDLATRDPDVALATVARHVRDWSGGTRLGEGLRRFNDLWGTRGVARGAVVVILSDGWDRGEPEELTREMARLARVAHRVIWVNPLKATEGFAPLARGMAAALPYVDEFVSGHSLAALDELAIAIGR